MEWLVPASWTTGTCWGIVWARKELMAKLNYLVWGRFYTRLFAACSVFIFMDSLLVQPWIGKVWFGTAGSAVCGWCSIGFFKLRCSRLVPLGEGPKARTLGDAEGLESCPWNTLGSTKKCVWTRKSGPTCSKMPLNSQTFTAERETHRPPQSRFLFYSLGLMLRPNM